ncbi:ras guanine nucleotide exchange factor domain-containing protein [Cytidiella melzeri]|nr:ras guanine nucleotide exchange factor domain-containing protein [Cytidiella melzeri]
MAAVYTSQHNGLPNAFSGSHITQQAQPVDPPAEEQYITTFFCRALYDYQTNDASSLSFRRGDIIEVLTRLDSGWWDGLLGPDDRGWFPSNYVTIITDQEAEAALSASDTDTPPAALQDDSAVDMARSMASSVSSASMSNISRALSQSDREGDWLDRDPDYAPPSYTQQASDAEDYYSEALLAGQQRDPTQTHDFWVPRVSDNGRIFYINTQTGERSNDLPQEAADDSDTDLALHSRQSSSRLGANRPAQDAGFGVPARSRTPEPWVRRLADDGLSYYYVNRLDGTVSWTIPQASVSGTPLNGHAYAQPQAGPSAAVAPSVAARLRSESSVSGMQGMRQRAYSSTDRASLYSDEELVQPGRRSRTESSASSAKPTTGAHRNGKSIQAQPELAPISDMTPAEQLAKVLQRTLSPNAPESPTELSDHVRDAISAVVDFLQSSTTARRPDHVQAVNSRVLGVVAAVRNLLYVTATPSGHIPSNLYPRASSADTKYQSNSQALQSHLKAAHRKVAGTLSKLVLSALAMQYDPALSTNDKPNRMESDAAELERSVVAFVAELQRFQRDNPSLLPSEGRRLQGVLAPNNIGPGLPGAGLGGDWKGFGYSPIAQGRKAPHRVLRPEVMKELKTSVETMNTQLSDLASLWRSAENDRLQADGRTVVAHLSAILVYVCDINIAKHVDIDGVRTDTGYFPPYLQAVEKARRMQRTLELVVQALYDDAATLLAAVQAPLSTDVISDSPSARYDYVDALARTISTNLESVVSTLDSLWLLGQNQAELAETVYSSSIEWRQSRGSVFFQSTDAPPAVEGASRAEEDVVDMELAFSRQGGFRTMSSLDSGSTAAGMYRNGPRNPSETSLEMSDRSRSEGIGEPVTPTWPAHEPSETGTLVASGSLPDLDGDLLEDEEIYDEQGPSSSKSPARTNKLIKLLGEAPQHYINKVHADSQPWYLRPNYDQSEILMDPDGSVRAGSKQALVERLTPHETADAQFGKNFLITFKSFMTLDELFDLLVQRFWIEPPENLTPEELEDWTKQKQTSIRLRVLNTFRTMVNDDDILEKEDVYILDKIREFCVKAESTASVAAAKQLGVLIDRVQRGGENALKAVLSNPVPPPPSILPKSSKKLKLLDIDPLELARQLTLLEAKLYKTIRPIECLQRSREQRVGKNNDNIASIIQLSNRIANWVAESVLQKEDSRKRAAVVKHFISVADRCRNIQNFSTMVAITSGLNTPPIRRLKRTWEQVNQRFMSQLHICESTIDSNKNFNNYRSLLARIAPPCVPFIGTYLTTLTFINDGAEDKVAGHMINFRKRQKAAEVIRDIKQWQTIPYNFTTVSAILAFLEDSFEKYVDGVDYGDQFWNTSLEREPREREDEKMARLLQESGFL